MQIVPLNYSAALDVLREFANHDEFQLEMDAVERAVAIVDSLQDEIFRVKLPFVFPGIGEGMPHEDYMANVPEFPPSYIILQIQAGSAALGYFEFGEVLHHKVIRKYMVRKKQGKSQVKHLKSKGKSRLGSRIRLANTIAFFQEINQYLIDWCFQETVENIYYSCSKTLWPKVFEAKPNPPFTAQDERLQKLPIDPSMPNHESLLNANAFLVEGTLEISDEISISEVAEILPPGILPML